MMNVDFSLHQRSEDSHGTYDRRSGEGQGERVRVAGGKLSLTKLGLELLLMLLGEGGQVLGDGQGSTRGGSCLVNNTKSCPQLSISGTAYYALGLVANI